MRKTSSCTNHKKNHVLHSYLHLPPCLVRVPTIAPLFKAELAPLANAPTPNLIIYHLSRTSLPVASVVCPVALDRVNYSFSKLQTRRCRLTKHRNTLKKSALVSFMVFPVFEEHARTAIVIRYVISGATVDKKTNITAWKVFSAIHACMFLKRHKSDDVWEIFLLKIKVVKFQRDGEFLHSEKYFTCENWKLLRISRSLNSNSDQGLIQLPWSHWR